MTSQPAPPNYKLWRNLGLLGLLGAFMVGVGEFMVHFDPTSSPASGDFSFFGGVSDSSFATGHFLMVAFLPLYILGYLHFYLGMRSGGEKLARAVFVLGVFAFMIGGIWAGSRAFLGSLEHLLNKPETSEIWNQVVVLYKFYLEILVQALRVLVLSISACFIAVVLRGNTFYPRWFAACAPIIPLLIIFLLFFTVPDIGKYLLPAAMNVTHTLVFALSLYSGSRHLRKTSSI
ncbi:hypothetical protein OAF27_02865 [Verrucomicrobiales bacterium]|nr:hypothetical protein [Verrucomicrobiales bacterium]